MSKRMQSKFLSWGFTGIESQEFGEQFTMQDVKEIPYLRKMILDRRMLTLNAKQYHWDYEKSLRQVRKQYTKNKLLDSKQNITDKIAWKLFRLYKDRQKELTGQVYETPRHKMAERDFIPTKPSEKKKQMLRDNIRDLNSAIANVKDESSKERFTKERDGLQKQLDNLK
jgi:hypothetical protein